MQISRASAYGRWITSIIRMAGFGFMDVCNILSAGGRESNNEKRAAEAIGAPFKGFGLDSNG